VLHSFRGAAFWLGKENLAGNTRWYFQGIFRSIGGKLPVKTYRGSTPLGLEILDRRQMQNATP